MISIVTDPGLRYPGNEDFFSPDESFPEYAYPHLAKEPNPVYRAVRNCFLQAGLDWEHANTSSWNPLGGFIRPGNKVFILCNFVFHRVAGESAEQFAAKCIHGSVLRAVADYALLATGAAGVVRFGNAPMQFCHWDSVLNDTGARILDAFYASNGALAESRDLRLFVAVKNRYGAITEVQRREESDGIGINLNGDSVLTEIDRRPTVRYRIMNYSPKRLEFFHTLGKHIYVINRQILESDVVISLPKLKTHEKVGISGALKGFVGAVGHKDSLPHHRFGSPDVGGDEYPSDKTRLLRLASAYHNRVQRTRIGGVAGNFLRVTDRMFRHALTPIGPVTEGAWWGNDTAWRMVVDLARIATFATAQGKMERSPVRRHIVLVDGIIAGEGQGPLNPAPVHAGTILFSDNIMAADYASALLMGIDPHQLPMLSEAVSLSRYPLSDRELFSEPVVLNGHQSSLSELQSVISRPFRPPLGWEEYSGWIRKSAPRFEASSS